MNSVAYAQEESNEKFSFTFDFANNFVWRGQALNMSPVLQPEFSFNIGNFSIGTWASTPFSSFDYTELDLFVNYQLTPFLSVGIVNYFGYDNSFSTYNYFDFDKENTGHSFDLQVMYEGDNGFNAMVSTIIAGDDLKYNDNGEVKGSNFSTYLELGYGSTTRYGVDWNFCVGFVPMASDFYMIDKANVVNLSFGVSKTFQITPTYSLPLSLNFTVNPAAEAALLTAAIKLF